MKSEPATHSLEELSTSYSDKHLTVNPEYQRGATWNVRQQRSLIDSILRGFVLPIFYVHVVKTKNLFTNSEMVTASLVDGQQRLNAITEFMRGRFALNDPGAATGFAMVYERDNPPRWSGKRFDELLPEDRARFLKHPLQVVRMEEEAANEVRDLFIRLQSGTPLNPQEKRDAWPGNFTLFVIKHAGKDRHPASNPHRFFDLVKHVGGKAAGEDEDIYIDRRSNTRKFFAGLAMTYLVRQESQVDFVDLKASNIDAFYLNKAGMPLDEPGALNLLRLLTEASGLPEIQRITGNKLRFQWAFHFALLIDSMLGGDYVDSSWRPKIVDAFEKFRAECMNAAKAFKQGERTRHYSEFVQPLSGSGSDTAETIRRRHQFLLSEIVQILQPRPRDPLRIFGHIEREIIWYRQSGRCAHPHCLLPTPLSEMHAHHIREHSSGGTTTLENGVLVCRTCHQNRRDMQSLEEHFQQLIASGGDPSPDDADAALEATDRKLKIEINWPAFGKGDSPEIIQRSTDTDAIVRFCNRLVDVFGDEAITWMSDRPMIRFPVTKFPEESFKNPVSGKIYSYRPIGNSGYFVCTHSAQAEKVRRLQAWISGLPEPIDESINVSVDTTPPQ